MSDRCKAMTKKVWHTPVPRACKLPAWKDGFCRKHHPANRGKRGDIANEIARCKGMVTRAEERVVRVKNRLTELEREQQKWLAFLGGGGGVLVCDSTGESKSAAQTANDQSSATRGENL